MKIPASTAATVTFAAVAISATVTSGSYETELQTAPNGVTVRMQGPIARQARCASGGQPGDYVTKDYARVTCTRCKEVAKPRRKR